MFSQIMHPLQPFSLNSRSLDGQVLVFTYDTKALIAGTFELINKFDGGVSLHPCSNIKTPSWATFLHLSHLTIYFRIYLHLQWAYTLTRIKRLPEHFLAIERRYKRVFFTISSSQSSVSIRSISVTFIFLSYSHHGQRSEYVM